MADWPMGRRSADLLKTRLGTQSVATRQHSNSGSRAGNGKRNWPQSKSDTIHFPQWNNRRRPRSGGRFSKAEAPIEHQTRENLVIGSFRAGIVARPVSRRTHGCIVADAPEEV